MNEYLKLIGELGDLSEMLDNALGERNRNIKEIRETYIDADYRKHREEQEDEKLETYRKKLVAKARLIAFQFESRVRDRIEREYFATLNNDIINELNLIRLSNFDIDELNEYLNKYKNNKTVLRSIESIVNEQGYKVEGYTRFSHQKKLQDTIQQSNESIINTLENQEVVGDWRRSVVYNLAIESIKRFDREPKELKVVV